MVCMCDTCRHTRKCPEYKVQMNKKRKRERYSASGKQCLNYCSKRVKIIVNFTKNDANFLLVIMTILGLSLAIVYILNTLA